MIAGLGLIYLLRAGWREARWRWAIDLFVVVIGGMGELRLAVGRLSGLAQQTVPGGAARRRGAVLPGARRVRGGRS